MPYPLLCEWTHDELFYIHDICCAFCPHVHDAYEDMHVMQPYGVLHNDGHAFCVLHLYGELDGSLRDDLQ